MAQTGHNNRATFSGDLGDKYWGFRAARVEILPLNCQLTFQNLRKIENENLFKCKHTFIRLANCISMCLLMNKIILKPCLCTTTVSNY